MISRLKGWRILQPIRPAVRLFRRAKHETARSVQGVRWQRLLGGPPIPPPHEYKVSVILKYARRFQTPSLIETGTYLGETVEDTRSLFEHVWSIEIDEQLYEAAARQFAADANVTIVRGDSAKVLPSILATQEGPVLFWLDGHYSGGTTSRGDSDTPILAELEAVLARSRDDDVILIDDARHFGTGDYPTIAQVTGMISGRRPAWQIEVRSDIIRAHRRG